MTRVWRDASRRPPEVPRWGTEMVWAVLTGGASASATSLSDDEAGGPDRLQDDAADPGDVAAHVRHLDHVAGLRGLEELPAPDVDADVGHGAVEEHQVAGLGVLRGDGD